MTYVKLLSNVLFIYKKVLPFTVVATSKACVDTLDTGTVGSNPLQGKKVCPRLSACAVPCRQRPCDGPIPIQGVVPKVNRRRFRNHKGRRPRLSKNRRATEKGQFIKYS
jgi:hypothetical protein